MPKSCKRILAASLHDHDFSCRFAPMGQSFTYPRGKVVSLVKLKDLVVNTHRVDYLAL